PLKLMPLELQSIDRVVQDRLECLGTFPDQELIGIYALGHGGNADLDRLGQVQVDRLVGSRVAGDIGVEQQHNAVGKSLQHLDVLVSQGGSQHGHDVGHA